MADANNSNELAVETITFEAPDASSAPPGPERMYLHSSCALNSGANLFGDR